MGTILFVVVELIGIYIFFKEWDLKLDKYISTGVVSFHKEVLQRKDVLIRFLLNMLIALFC